MLRSLALINLYVSDVERSRAFYCDALGVPIANPTSTNLDKYLPLAIDGPEIFLHYTTPEQVIDYRHRGIDLLFEVDDVEEVAKTLRAKGIAIRNGPLDLDWRPWKCLEVEDPDGYLIYLVSPRG